MNEFLVLERIGPLETGTRAGVYLEAGDGADRADFASDDNINALMAAGVLTQVSAAATPAHADAAEDLSEHGTDDRHSH